MKKPCAVSIVVILVHISIGASNLSAQAAIPICLGPSPGSPSATPGTLCGGDPALDVPDMPNHSIDLNRDCKTLYGAQAVANTLASRSDAYAWVCRITGQSDKSIDMQSACRRQYGDDAIATLVGLGSNDWRCLRPADVGGHVVPVLLFPQEKLYDAPEPAFVQTSLQRLSTLSGGIRRFYREHTSARLQGTNAFVLLSKTTAKEWQNLALCTDQDACHYVGSPFPFDRNGYANRIQHELADGRWNVLVAHSTVIVGAFVSLGSSPSSTPTWCGALDLSGQYFVTAPSNSYAACSATVLNPGAYENAFYGAGHELGHAMGLRHSNDPTYCPDTQSYVFHDVDAGSNLLRPPNLADSIMCLGKGTSSELFPFEASRVLQFLVNWH